MIEWFKWVRACLGDFVDGATEFIEPAVSGCMPFIRFMSDINIYVVVTVFVLLLLFMLIIRGHSVLEKLMNPRNYFALILMFAIYMFFSKAASIKLGGGYTLQLSTLILPMAAKLMGPILGGAVGIILFMASYWLQANAVQFSINMIFISGISGMLYGWIFYAYPTRFWRCLVAKLVVTLVCNILIYPLVQSIPEGAQYVQYAVDLVSFRLVEGIFMAPVYAVFIYIELIIMRYIRVYLEDSSWSLKN